MTYADQMIARSADTVLVSVDRIVPSGDIISRPRETSIPCIYVDAVVEIPFGAHPTGSFPNYSIDEAHIDSYATYAEAARKGSPTGDANLQAYIERHVIAPQDQEGYLTTVGGDTRMEELVAEAQAL